MQVTYIGFADSITVENKVYYYYYYYYYPNIRKEGITKPKDNY